MLKTTKRKKLIYRNRNRTKSWYSNKIDEKPKANGITLIESLPIFFIMNQLSYNLNFMNLHRLILKIQQLAYLVKFSTTI